MKILYIVTHSDGGGAQRYVLDLAHHFHGSIAAGGGKIELSDSAKKLGIPFYSLKYLQRSINPYYDLLAVFELVKLIKNLNPDIVHLNSSNASY